MHGGSAPQINLHLICSMRKNPQFSCIFARLGVVEKSTTYVPAVRGAGLLLLAGEEHPVRRAGSRSPRLRGVHVTRLTTSTMSASANPPVKRIRAAILPPSDRYTWRIHVPKEITMKV